MKTQFLLLSGSKNLKITELNLAKIDTRKVSKAALTDYLNPQARISGPQVEIQQKAFLQLDWMNCPSELAFIQRDNSKLHLKIPIFPHETNLKSQPQKTVQKTTQQNLEPESKNLFNSKLPLEILKLEAQNYQTELNFSQLKKPKILEINIWQVGQNCQTEVEIFGHIAEPAQIKIKVWHLGPFGKSSQKSAFLVQNQLELEGKIIIKAKDCQATFDSHNLLTEGSSTAKLWPVLEIYQPPLECTHAATISSFDQDTLNYLQTRQLNPSQSKNLLAEHFLDEFLS